MNYISTPNLPDRKSEIAIMNDPYGLTPGGMKIIPAKKISGLAAPESMHADMQIVHLGKNIFVCPPSLCDYYKNKLPDAQIIPGSSELKEKYPYNIAYNVCILGNKMICHTEYTDKTILKTASDMGIIAIKSRQGYSKCSICVVTQNAIITSDNGIFELAVSNDIDVLLIQPGYILLPGYDYGFIGGCSGKISNDTLYFYGNISSHPDYDKIKKFASGYGIHIEYSDKYPLTDIGSILPL